MSTRQCPVGCRLRLWAYQCGMVVFLTILGLSFITDFPYWWWDSPTKYVWMLLSIINAPGQILFEIVKRWVPYSFYCHLLLVQIADSIQWLLIWMFGDFCIRRGWSFYSKAVIAIVAGCAVYLLVNDYFYYGHL